MGSSCEACCATTSTAEDDETIKKKRIIDDGAGKHERVPSLERMPTVTEMDNLINKKNISRINIDPTHCKVPTMGNDAANLILANPFAPGLDSVEMDEIEVGMIVHVEIGKISKYGIQCKIPSYDLNGFISKENISEELNKKLNHYGKEGDVKYMIRSHLKNLQSLLAKVLTYDPTTSIATCSCVDLDAVAAAHAGAR